MDPRRLNKKQTHAGWQTHSCKITSRTEIKYLDKTQHHSSDYKVLLFLKRVMIGHLKIFANIYHYYSITDILPNPLSRLRTILQVICASPQIISELKLSN